jgi:hypothetical protein
MIYPLRACVFRALHVSILSSRFSASSSTPPPFAPSFPRSILPPSSTLPLLWSTHLRTNLLIRSSALDPLHRRRRSPCRALIGERDGSLEGLEELLGGWMCGCGQARQMKELDGSLPVRSLSALSFLSSIISIGGSSSRIRASRHEAREYGRAGMRACPRGIASVWCLHRGCPMWVDRVPFHAALHCGAVVV